MILSKLEQQVLKSLLAREAKYSKQIQKQLSVALTSIYGEMKKIYDNYAVNGKLTRAEMTKYNKYETMEKQILAKLDPAIKANIKTIQKLLPEQFNQSFYQYAWAIDNATGLRLSWGMVNTKQLLQIFDITNPKNIELREALKNYGPTAKKRIRAALLNGLSLGKSYDKMAKDLKTQLNKTFNDAIRIVRTEGQSAINAGQAIAYERAKENGINGNEVWSATKDQKTRLSHRHADGQKKGEIIKNAFSIDGNPALYPGDPQLPAEDRINCRCNIRFEIEGYSPQLMRTREEGILPYMPYNEYVKEYHPDWIVKEKHFKKLQKETNMGGPGSGRRKGGKNSFVTKNKSSAIGGAILKTSYAKRRIASGGSAKIKGQKTRKYLKKTGQWL